MLAEDLSDEPAAGAIPKKNTADAVDTSSRKTRPESSDDDDRHEAKLVESQDHLSKVDEEESRDPKELQRLNVEVNATLHSQFKAMVGMRKTTMRQVVESFMRRYVEEVKKEFFSSR